MKDTRLHEVLVTADEIDIIEVALIQYYCKQSKGSSDEAVVGNLLGLLRQYQEDLRITMEFAE